MQHTTIIQALSKNGAVFQSMLTGLSSQEYLWKPQPEKWCLLEIVCHLYDEEREDFRARIRHVLETPAEPLPPIDPPGWVQERAYLRQDFADTLDRFVKEREASVAWLQSLSAPNWDSAYMHPKFGPMTASMFLSNWLAHDYLHMRQILQIKFGYLQQLSNESLKYAGEW